MTDPGGSHPPTRTGWLDWLARGDWAGLALRAVLVAAVSVAAAWLLAPAGASRLPGPEALGSPSPGTVKADRDYDIADPEATERRRAEAAEAERPVYVLDAGAGDEAAARVHAAFRLMRDEATAVPVRHGAGAADLQRRWTAQRDAFVSRLQVLVRDEDLAALGQARFSETVEQELVSLARRGLDGMVVEDLALLAAEREHGFVVRTVRDGAQQGEKVVTDLALVRDVATATAEVESAAAARLEREPAPLRTAVRRIAVAMIRPTLAHDQVETVRRRRDAAARVKPVVVPVKRGEKIIGDGEQVEKRHLVVFDGMRAQRRGEILAHVRLGAGALVALMVALLWSVARRNLPRFRPARRDALLLAVLLVGTFGLGSIGIAVADALQERFPLAPPTLQYLVPFAAGAMIVRQVLAADAALLFALAAGLAAGLLAGQSMPYALYATLTSIAAAGLVSGQRDRAGIFRAGLGVGLVGVALAVATGLFAGRSPGDVAIAALAALAGGALLLPVVVVGVLPIVEAAFGYVTDVKLIELANLNHPALKELIVQAPGTYHHSILMGSLVEAAAEALGANPLLARVQAYYHDLGKIRNPLFFAENQRSGENKHDALAPSMSALIVKRHVTDGLELARRWRIPRPVADAIPQHHGTRHVGYFWAKAQRLAEEAGGRASAPDEALFRYPGPRPQTREAALVMIADACEASSRALDAPTGEALRELVSKRINEVFGEGQLDDCELTLRDLGAIAAAMVRALEAIYHTRPEYPGKRDEERRPPLPVHLVAKP